MHKTYTDMDSQLNFVKFTEQYLRGLKENNVCIDNFVQNKCQKTGNITGYTYSPGGKPCYKLSAVKEDDGRFNANFVLIEKVGHSNASNRQEIKTYREMIIFWVKIINFCEPEKTKQMQVNVMLANINTESTQDSIMHERFTIAEAEAELEEKKRTFEKDAVNDNEEDLEFILPSSSESKN